MYLTVRLWLNYLDVLSLSFLLCKIGKTILHLKESVLMIEGDNTQKSSWHTEGAQ